MTGYQTGHAELMAAAKELEQGNADLMAELSSLASAVEGVAGQWAGSAKTAFDTLIQKFSQDAKVLNEKLIEISQQVTGSAQAYLAQEEQANASLSAITNTLNG